ncbi:type II toxin-antitoxin system VapC family toxin [Corynebacterium glutamicum]|uniref:type II toxin-antitoxin system VapC family toxin n=1 Tax=Corynebacterium glutamicum TaxID=1718 RepID=UPI003C79B7C8
MSVVHKFNLPRIIIDTCAWITFLCYKAESKNLRKDALCSEPEEVASRVNALIDGNGKDHIIVMPTVIYAELLGIIRGKGRTPTSRLRLVNTTVDFLQSLDFIFMELDEETALDAEIHIKSFELTGIDAAILTSAAYFECRYVYTSDEKMLKVGDQIPGVSVCLPPEPSTLIYQSFNTETTRTH